jgi:NADH dehydrogenase FAD-containing subunit
MKTIHDALVLRFDRAPRARRHREDPARKRALLDCGRRRRGSPGVETIGAINDFLRGVRAITIGLGRNARLVLVEPMERLLRIRPGAREYTASKLQAAGIDVRVRTVLHDRRTLSLDPSSDSATPSLLAARTPITDARVAPSPLIEAVSLSKAGPHRGEATLAVPGKRVGVR